MQSLTCGVLDPVPRPGIEPWFPALAVRRSLSHRTTRKVLVSALQCLQSVLWLNASPFSVATSLVPGKDVCPPGALSPRQTLKGKPFSPASHTPLTLTILVFQFLFPVLPPLLSHIPFYVCMCAQSCPTLCYPMDCSRTLCYPMDCSRPGSSVCGIFQARILEWIAISLSNILLHTVDLNTVHIYFCI